MRDHHCCRTCWAWEEFTEDPRGICRRHAPRLTRERKLRGEYKVTVGPSIAEATWPVTDSGDGCFEWVEMPPKPLDGK